jgi:hypothetical protein
MHSDPVRLGDPPEIELPDGRRFTVGEPGDWLLVGDWDCDGSSSPALYRPRTGVAYLFDAWATGGPLESVTTRRTGILGGTPRVTRTDRCERLRIDASAPAPPSW